MKWISRILILVILWFTFCLVFTASGDFNQDLGRHIKLGEIILNDLKIPKTNTFSYTHPQFPFSNHHWLSEVIYYLIATAFGKSVLLYLKVMLILTSAYLVIKTAVKKSGSTILSVLSFLMVSPLLLERSDIRPEMFGYLFFSISLSLMFGYPKNKKFIVLLIPVMIAWINIHITFIFGIFILALFAVKIAIPKLLSKQKDFDKKSMILVFAAILSAVINPNGIYGMTYPLNIFKNYGYTIVENQSLFFLNGLMFNPTIRWFTTITPVIVVAFALLLWKKKLTESIVLTVFFIATIYQIRHMPFFIWASVIPLSMAYTSIVPKKIITKQNRLLSGIFLTCIIITLSLFFLTNGYARTFDKSAVFGQKVEEDGKGAADFMLKHNLKGNIFNNFDIGGYAIYRLYPKYKVFVDNRPEAYPAAFFTDTYIPMQYDPELRKKVFDEYDINTIFFSHTDQTPWANEFLASIAADKEWKLVYLDNSMMIMSRGTTLPDVRNNDAYLETRLEESKYYLDKLKLSRALSIFGKSQLATTAYEQAKADNPDSCALNRGNHERYKNSPLAKEAEQIKQNYWYCF